jgi:hypothetical protein
LSFIFKPEVLLWNTPQALFSLLNDFKISFTAYSNGESDDSFTSLNQKGREQKHFPFSQPLSTKNRLKKIRLENKSSACHCHF